MAIGVVLGIALTASATSDFPRMDAVASRLGLEYAAPAEATSDRIEFAFENGTTVRIERPPSRGLTPLTREFLPLPDEREIETVPPTLDTHWPTSRTYFEQIVNGDEPAMSRVVSLTGVASIELIAPQPIEPSDVEALLLTSTLVAAERWGAFGTATWREAGRVGIDFEPSAPGRATSGEANVASGSALVLDPEGETIVELQRPLVQVRDRWYVAPRDIQTLRTALEE